MKKQSGFTLMETLIAMLILSGALVVLHSTWSGSLLAVKKSQGLQTVATLLQRKVVEVQAEMRGLKFNEIKESESGDFGEEYPGFSWGYTVQDFPAPDLRSAVGGASGDGQQIDDFTGTILSKFSEHLEKSVKELRITVFWQQGEKTLEYSITTLLVDYERPLQL